jgi:hypothetical protein
MMNHEWSSLSSISNKRPIYSVLPYMGLLHNETVPDLGSPEDILKGRSVERPFPVDWLSD